MRDFDNKGTDRESTEEDTAIAWAVDNGWEWRLMSYRGRNGCPDTWFFGYGEIIPIEFKKPKGGRMSANQSRERDRMAKVGVTFFKADTAAEAIAILRRHMP